jgi:hypothetical protein
MARGGRDKDRGTPERRCLVTRQSGPKAGLIRFVVSPDGTVLPDLMARLPGRGMYVAADGAALAEAAKRNPFSRAAKMKVQVPDDLVAQVETHLARRVIELISLARKAGGATAGYERVKSWIGEGTAEVLIQASDGSPRGLTKVRLPVDEGPTLTCLSASEIGLAFGRESVIHAALTGGGLTARIVDEAARLAGVRTSDSGTPAGKDTTNA